jgi:hypothetical protein
MNPQERHVLVLFVRGDAVKDDKVRLSRHAHAFDETPLQWHEATQQYYQGLNSDDDPASYAGKYLYESRFHMVGTGHVHVLLPIVTKCLQTWCYQTHHFLPF